MVIPSLLPYIKTGKNISLLNISRIPQQTISGGQLRFPFALISESGPFTHIIQAQIESDHGSIIKQVFLLLDKDTYLSANDESRGLNNELVEQCWQRAYENYRTDSSTILLADQIDEDGRLRQFQSLFYCQSRDIFFHPPCPHCGNPLTLCKDDDLLISFEIQAYSQSLKRYLYCPECLQNTGHSDFYAAVPDNTDPQFIKDLHQLIKGFGSLDEERNDQFPCSLCSLHNECYGDKDLALTRIIPISFYPFHLLIFESASINAFDFLALLSGASSEELINRLGENSQHGRIPFVNSVAISTAKASPYFFENDVRHFLELLYLKLSFLGQFAQVIFSNIDSYTYPDLGFSIDRIWVDLSHEDSLLPFFWNFHLRLMDWGGDIITKGQLPKPPPLYGNYILGTLWLRVLLLNKVHDLAEINTVLAKSLDQKDSLNAVLNEASVMEQSAHIFSPENIFWDPQTKSLPDTWTSLWEDALGLGWALLKNSTSQAPCLSEEDFWKGFENLRETIKKTMMSTGLPAASRLEDTSHDSAVHEILTKILAKWSSAQQKPEDELDKTVIMSESPADKSPDEELEETVILSNGHPSVDNAPTPSSGDEEDVLETVILSPDEAQAAHPENTGNDIPDTIIMNPEQPDLKTAEPSVPPSVPKTSSQEVQGREEDNLAETMIMRTGNEESRDEFTKDVDLDETVIVNPDKKDQFVKESSTVIGTEEAQGSLDEEDFLAETIILRPDKDKE
jgi:hypothetical protein